jgi:hypothetical protein
LIRKDFFQLYYFFSIFGHQNPGSGSGTGFGFALYAGSGSGFNEWIHGTGFHYRYAKKKDGKKKNFIQKETLHFFEGVSMRERWRRVRYPTIGPLRKIPTARQPVNKI